MTIGLIPFLFVVLGLLAYAASKNPTLREFGRLTALAGLVAIAIASQWPVLYHH